jgi:hypothetical protein
VHEIKRDAGIVGRTAQRWAADLMPCVARNFPDVGTGRPEGSPRYCRAESTVSTPGSRHHRMHRVFRHGYDQLRQCDVRRRVGEAGSELLKELFRDDWLVIGARTRQYDGAVEAGSGDQQLVTLIECNSLYVSAPRNSPNRSGCRARKCRWLARPNDEPRKNCQ